MDVPVDYPKGSLMDSPKGFLGDMSRYFLMDIHRNVFEGFSDVLS